MSLDTFTVVQIVIVLQHCEQDFPQCRAVRFTDGKKAGWVGDCFFPNDISQLRRPSNLAQRWCPVQGMGWCTHVDFWKSFLIVAKFAKEWANYYPHATSETKNSRNAEIGTNIVPGVRMMPELCVFKLCTALIYSCGKISSSKQANSKKKFPFTQWCHIYAETAYTWCLCASGFCTCYLRQCRALRTLWLVIKVLSKCLTLYMLILYLQSAKSKACVNCNFGCFWFAFA